MLKSIVVFHLYNDYSGSPRVLRNVIDGLDKRGYHIHLVTSKTRGVLDELYEVSNIQYDYFKYSVSNNRILWLFYWLYAQMQLFSKALKYSHCKIFYINTIMPIGAVVAGKLMGKSVIYHYHENASVKGLFYKGLAFLMQKLADEIICVSEYQRSFLDRTCNVRVIPNALSIDFEKACQNITTIERDRKSILMLSSLKAYKGVVEFINLAQTLSSYKFELVINDSYINISQFLAEYNLTTPDNLRIWDKQADVIPFYERNSLVLNLSNKDKCIETFGLTALEAMTAGLPVIVPTVGGIAEMVIDGYNGYKIDAKNFQGLVYAINLILGDKLTYSHLRKNAKEFAMRYSCENMINSIEKIINPMSYE